MAATDWSLAGVAVPGGDIGCINTDSGTITTGQVVIIDATNFVSSTGVSGFAAGLPTFGVKVAGAHVYSFGIALTTAIVGADLRVRRLGIAVCLAAGAITAGAIVTSAASGQVTTQTSGQPQLGQALWTTANANDPVLVALDIANNA